MFIFNKGKPKTTNIISDRKNKYFEEIQHGSLRQKNGSVKKTTIYGKKAIKEFGRMYNIWAINPQKQNRVHPAQFSERLASDHIISWSNKGDLVFDPFMGSGTTGKMAIINKRDFIGCELDQNYFKIAQQRINNDQP